MSAYVSLSEEWISLPDLAVLLGSDIRTVRNQARAGEFVAVPVEGLTGARVPREFLCTRDGQLQFLDGLAGSLTQLADAGLEPGEMVEWMLTPNAELGATPAAALATGGKHAVRRAAVAVD